MIPLLCYKKGINLEAIMYPSQEIIESLRERYPIGTRIKLVSVDDPAAPPEGTEGTVTGVDDIGSLLVDWDNGSTLNVIYGEDLARKL